VGGITSWGKGVAEFVIGLFEFVVDADGTIVGVGLQVVSKRIKTGTIRRFFMYIYNMTTL